MASALLNAPDRVLVHLCNRPEWESGPGPQWAPDSLADIGFIHLSAPEQVHLPANRLYAGRTDLVLLVIDPAKIDAEIRWEPGVTGDPESMRFPHLYGMLPRAAVVAILPYTPNADGMFVPPPFAGRPD